MWKRLVYTLLGVITMNTSYAQGYVDQEQTKSITNSQTEDVEQLQKVKWVEYEYKEYNDMDGKGVWTEFLEYIESLPGAYHGKRRYIVEMANRVSAENFKKGQKLLIPETFPEDYKAYSPYPFEYTAASTLPKIMIIDKYTQTFGAYEYGKLVRWGIVSTGVTDEKTPAGRYNFNWKAEYRESTAAPPGEVWELNYMFNFDAKQGLHVHQYALPISVAASHGCVRMSIADAIWNFNWANGWIQPEGQLARNGTPLIIIHQNPVDRAANWYVAGNEIESLVQLPADPDDIPAATYAQRITSWASDW